jgi:hypothetical protein
MKLPLLRVAPPRPRLPAEDPVLLALQERAKEVLVRTAPPVIMRLDAAREAYLRGDPESLAHALLSCRRALVALGNAVQPPSPHPVADHDGELHQIASGQVKNQLRYFFTRVPSKSARRQLRAELELLVVMLDRLLNVLGKGIHEEVPQSDVAEAYVLTWLLVSQTTRWLPED